MARLIIAIVIGIMRNVSSMTARTSIQTVGTHSTKLCFPCSIDRKAYLVAGVALFLSCHTRSGRYAPVSDVRGRYKSVPLVAGRGRGSPPAS